MEPKQTHDPELVQKGLWLHKEEIDLNVEAWLEFPLNVALEEDGNIGLFEYFAPGVYTGHYFFWSRGKEAKEIAIRMLRHMFQSAEVIRGLTPSDNRPAIWMTRHLGFKDYGEFEARDHMVRLFIMTKDEFNSRYEG